MVFLSNHVAEIEEAMAVEKQVRVLKKLQALRLLMDKIPQVKVAKLTGLSIPTLWRVEKDYSEKGLVGLKPNYKGGGRRKLTAEIERKALAKLENKALNGEFTRVMQLYEAFQSETNTTYGFTNFYKVLERNGWRRIMPQGQHPNKASEADCESAKKLTPQWPHYRPAFCVQAEK